ncbi:hypothetical protein ACT4UL_02890, partial [Bacillus sp. HC-TM]
MIPIRVKRGSKTELIKAVRELEKRGFDYVTPIKAVYKTKKDFVYNENKNITIVYCIILYHEKSFSFINKIHLVHLLHPTFIRDVFFHSVEFIATFDVLVF